VYWPQEPTGTGKTYPVLSYNHGFTVDGAKIDKYRRNLMLFFVKLGFVVVAHRQGNGHRNVPNTKTQLKAIQLLYDSLNGSRYEALVDQNGDTFLAGYSMGGEGTLKNAHKPDMIAKYNIKATMVFEPWVIDRCTKTDHIPVIPTMFFSGTKDSTAPNFGTNSIYYRTVLTNKVYIEREDQSHSSGPDNWLYDNDSSMEQAIIDFIECEMFENESHCVNLYGTDDISDSLMAGVPFNIKHVPGTHPTWPYRVQFPTNQKSVNLDWAKKGYQYNSEYTNKYRLTSGSTKTCDSKRDCHGRENYCSPQCLSPLYCGSGNPANPISLNCQECKS